MNTKEQLRELIPIKSKVNLIFHSVSSSGMLRRFKVLAVKNGEILDITYKIAEITGKKVNEKNGTISIKGCGMDMAFALTEQIKHALYTPEEHKEAFNMSYNGDYKLF